MAERRFSDDEVARILARAAEMQQQNQASVSTLEEIERAAAEAGIDPALVRSAATELQVRPAPSPTTTAFFGPTAITFDTVVDGEVSVDELPVVLETIQLQMNAPGHPSAIGTGVQWTSNDPQGRQLMVAVSSRDGRTTVRIHERLANLMGGIYGGVGGGAGGGAVIPGLAAAGAVLLGPVGGVVGGLLGTAISFVATRALYRFVANKRQVALQQAFEQIVREVQARARPVDLEAARARQGLLSTSSPLVTVGAVDAVDAVKETASRRQQGQS